MFILFGEANLGLEAAHLAECFKTIRGPNEFYSETERVGVMTTHQKKFGYVSKAEDFLGLDDAMRYAEPLAVGNPFLNVDQPAKVQRVKKKFAEQLTRFKKIVERPLSPHGVVKISYSGKVDAEGKISARFNDDLVMAWLIGMYFGDLFLKHKLPNIDYDRRFKPT